MKPEDVHHLIRNRRSIYPPQYSEKPISDHILMELLESANRAPTHKLTEPWRFKIIKGPALKRLGIFMAEKYRSTTSMEEFSVTKYDNLKSNPRKSGAVLAICMKRDSKGRIPEWEEIASVAMAVQNIWICCGVHHLGGYWSSPELRHHFHEFEPLEEGETCLGFFYMGYVAQPSANPPRRPIEEKIQWIRE